MADYVGQLRALEQAIVQDTEEGGHTTSLRAEIDSLTKLVGESLGFPVTPDVVYGAELTARKLRNASEHIDRLWRLVDLREKLRPS